MMCPIFQSCELNQLTLNTLKTNVLFFCRHHAAVDLTYLLDGISMKRVSIIKDLGVSVDNNLTFRNHIFLKGAVLIKC